MDQLNLERLGIPTVTVVTPEFAGLGEAVARAEGAGDMCLVRVPHPIGMIPQADVIGKAEGAFAEILKSATEWQPTGELMAAGPAYPAERFEFIGAAEDVSRLFFDNGWSLGLPIVPPTPERVEEMLMGTSRKPDDVLGQVPPRMGILTVELAAVHAVMSGCKPEYIPVLISALEALLTTEVNWKSGLVTTGTTQFVVIVNGPIVKEIGLAHEQGAAGKGHRPNAAIGYAVNLIAYVVGGSKPPSIDKSTLGSPADLVCWVFGENEDKMPPGWGPLHVDRGFRKSDSVVTVMVSYPPVDNLDHWSTTPEEHLRWWSHLVGPILNVGGPCGPDSMERNPIVALGPEHAQLLASAGWTKDDLRQSLWEQARLPLSVWPAGCPQMKRLIDSLGPVTPDTMIPITLEPAQFLIVVAGGAGKHSHYFPPFPVCSPGSKLVTK